MGIPFVYRQRFAMADFHRNYTLCNDCEHHLCSASRAESARRRTPRRRAETLYAQTSLAALQAQLNPHFLFNTLHSLMALVRYDSEKAEKAIEKLAEMLRYSLKDKRDSKNYLVRLADELQFVENYLELEKMRLGERLSVEKDIEKETLDCLIPAFTIQPLVENAIKARHRSEEYFGDDFHLYAKRERSFEN